MRIRIVRSVALTIATIALPLIASQASAQGRLRGVARLGVDYGGDKIGEFEYEDGSTPDVVAGAGLLLSIGGVMNVWAKETHAVEAQVNLGLKWRTIPPADNQDANWLRFPLEGMVFYRMPAGVRLGAGVTTHLHNVISASGAVLNDKVEFEASPGFLLQAEYVRKNIGFDLRYTSLSYTVDGASGDIDASSIGGGVSFYFGRKAAPATR